MRRSLLAVLLSSIVLTAAASPVPQNDASLAASRPISTGVTSPRLVYSTHVNIPADELSATAGSSAKVVLKVNLDETGSPSNVQVLHPATPEIDARIVNAVRQFRWTPAILNNKAVPEELTLTVEVQR
jgi:TonB family protein